MSVAEAFVTLRADDSKLDRDIQGSMSRIGGIIGKGALAGGAALAGIGIAGVNAFTGFERQMNEVFTLLPGISGEAMKSMEKDVKAFSREFGTLPKEVVPALYQSLSAGVPPDNVFAFLETAQKAAVGGVTDLSTAVDGISSVVNAYGDDVIDAAKASDLMFTAVRLGKTDFTQLSQSLFNVIPTASALGVEFGDVTAALAALTAQGTPTSVATTQMRQLFVELSKDGGKAAGVFQEMSGKTFKDFIASGGNVQDALILMEKAAEQSGVGISDLFGSVEAGNAALGLTGKGAETFSANIEAMGASAGATEAAYEQMDQGIGRAFDKLKANAQVILIEIGEKLAPVVSRAADVMLEAFERFSAWWDENGTKVIERASKLRDGLVTAFNVIKSTVETVVGFVSGLLDKFRGDMGDSESKVSTSAAQIGTILGQLRDTFKSIFDAIRVVVRRFTEVVAVLWERFGDTLLEHGRQTFENVLRVISGALDVIQGVFEVFVGVFTGDWRRAWDGVKQILSGVWDAIEGVVDQALSTVKTIVQVGMGLIDQLWDQAWESVKRDLVASWEAIKTATSAAIEALLTFFRELPARIGSALLTLPAMMRQLGVDMIQGMIDGAGSLGSALKNKITDTVSGAVDGIKSFLGISSPSKLFFGFGQDTVEGYMQGLQTMSGDLFSTMQDIFGGAADQVGTMVGGIGSLRGNHRARQELEAARADLTRLENSSKFDPAAEAKRAAAQQRFAQAREGLIVVEDQLNKAREKGIVGQFELITLERNVAHWRALVTKEEAEYQKVMAQRPATEAELIAARERLTDAELRAIQSEAQLIKLSNDLIGTNDAGSEMWHHLAGKIGLTKDRAHELIGQLNTHQSAAVDTIQHNVGIAKSYDQVEAAIRRTIKAADDAAAASAKRTTSKAKGDGPGAVGLLKKDPAISAMPALGAGGGTAANWARAAIAQFGGRITSTYRTPARNKAIGGSPTSYHLDRKNPAQDLVTSNMARTFNWLAAQYGRNVREMIYGNTMIRRGVKSRYGRNDHWDHIHIAHQGGVVSDSWPTLPGLRTNERPVITEVGETITPKGGGGDTYVVVELDGEQLTAKLSTRLGFDHARQYARAY